MLRIIINFEKTSGNTRAGSLAFTVLLSFIPFIISMAGIIGLLPFSNHYITRVEKYFFTNYIPHGGTQIYTQVKVFLQQSQELSWFGFSSLIVTTYMMLFAMERQLNALWHMKRQSSVFNSLRTHTLFLLCGFCVIGIMTILRIYSHVFLNSPTINFFFDQSLTTFVTIIMFSLVYKFMPSHSVSLPHAIIAGFTATLLFSISKQLFVFYSVHLFVNYHVIYGSMAFVPLFLIWIYISCLNLLFCAEIIYGLESRYNPRLQRIFYAYIQRKLNLIYNIINQAKT